MYNAGLKEKVARVFWRACMDTGLMEPGEFSVGGLLFMCSPDGSVKGMNRFLDALGKNPDTLKDRTKEALTFLDRQRDGTGFMSLKKAIMQHEGDHRSDLVLTLKAYMNSRNGHMTLAENADSLERKPS